MSINEFKVMALSFPGTIDAPHFDRTAFKVVNRRIFATVHKESNTANLKLSVEEQQIFCSFYANYVYPVPNKWGLQGWTTIELSKAPDELLLAALESAYKEVFIKKK
jgi:hypothetical protein